MNPTQVIIKKTETFDIIIGEKTYKGFKKISEWNGMIEFENSTGTIIVHGYMGIGAACLAMFVKDKDNTEFEIVKMSPVFYTNAHNDLKGK